MVTYSCDDSDSVSSGSSCSWATFFAYSITSSGKSLWTYAERNERGQFPLYNKVAGVVVTGNEDGAHAAAESTLFNLSHFGCAIPPNADTYWVGDAGPGPSYIEAGQDHVYTKRTTKWMALNLVHLAKTLRANPFTEPIPPLDADHSPGASAMESNLLGS